MPGRSIQLQLAAGLDSDSFGCQLCADSQKPTFSQINAPCQDSQSEYF